MMAATAARSTTAQQEALLTESVWTNEWNWVGKQTEPSGDSISQNDD